MQEVSSQGKPALQEAPSPGKLAMPDASSHSETCHAKSIVTKKTHFARKTVTMRTFFARNIVTMKTCLPWRSPCVVAGVLGRRGFPPETAAAVGTHNATDTTVVGDSRGDNPTPGADRHDGVALSEERRRQARTCTELFGESGRIKLVVLAGGRCSVHAMTC